MMIFKTLHIIIAIVLVSFYTSHSQSRTRTNWLQEKKEHEARWRFGIGANLGEPTGIGIQFYKATRICTQAITIRKKLSVDIAISYEGLLYARLLEQQNELWDKGGIRFNLDFKYYMPFRPNPYIALGGETGTRNLNEALNFHSDIVGRLGVEVKLFGTKTSTRSMLHSSLIFEGKYNHSLSSDFHYILPCVGLRVHFL